jgi:hypothetical protein
MLRRLFTLPPALSLLLLMAVIALWCYGCRQFYQRTETVAGRSVRVKLLPHVVWVEWTDRPYYNPGVRVEPQRYGNPAQFGNPFLLRRTPPPVIDTSMKAWLPRNPQQVGSETYFLLGFGYRPPWFQRGKPCTFTSVGIPLWFPAVALSVLPARWLRRVWRSRRGQARGLCPVCGYDLRATPSRCPECGAVPVTKGVIPERA